MFGSSANGLGVRTSDVDMCLIFPQGVRDYILGQQSDAMDEMVLRVRRWYQFFDRRLNHRSIVFVPVALTSAFSLSLSLPHSHAHTHTHARAATYATATATAPARRYDERRDAQDCARTDHHVRRSSVGPRLRYLPAQRTRAWIAPSSFCFVLFPPFLLFCFVSSFLCVCRSFLQSCLHASPLSSVLFRAQRSLALFYLSPPSVLRLSSTCLPLYLNPDHPGPSAGGSQHGAHSRLRPVSRACWARHGPRPLAQDLHEAARHQRSDVRLVFSLLCCLPLCDANRMSSASPTILLSVFTLSSHNRLTGTAHSPRTGMF